MTKVSRNFTFLGLLLLALVTAAYAAPAVSWPATQAASCSKPGFGDTRVSARSRIASGRHANPGLEGLLPRTLGGIALTVESQSGSELTTSSPAFDTFLASLGKGREDFSVASAYSLGELRAEIGAWHVKGADPALLLPAFETAMQAASKTPLAQVEETFGERTVMRIGDPGQLARGPLYVFVRADALLFVETPDRALAREALAKLPK